MEIQRRFVSSGAELRASGTSDKMELHLRVVKYNSPSELGVPVHGAKETIRPGAFTRSLATGNDVVADFGHDNDKVLGRTRNGTLSLTDSPDALRAVVRLNPQVIAHRDTWNLVRAGTLGDCSFGFTVTDDDFTNERSEGRSYVLRSVKAATLHSVSLVTYPAYGNGATSAEARAEYRFNNTESLTRPLTRAEADRMIDESNRSRAREIYLEMKADEERAAREEEEDEDSEEVTCPACDHKQTAVAEDGNPEQCEECGETFYSDCEDEN